VAVGRLLLGDGWSLGVAESLTGGMIGSRITGVAGASDWFRGSIVSYASEVKRRVLGVAPGPVVSAPAAKQMAIGARDVLGADVGLGITGVAGPAESEGQPVGTVWVGLAIGDGEPEAVELRGAGGRDQIRGWATVSALDLLRRRLMARVNPDGPTPDR
jgi:nicotinamide-nucleotide amidase